MSKSIHALSATLWQLTHLPSFPSKPPPIPGLTALCDHMLRETVFLMEKFCRLSMARFTEYSYCFKSSLVCGFSIYFYLLADFCVYWFYVWGVDEFMLWQVWKLIYLTLDGQAPRGDIFHHNLVSTVATRRQRPVYIYIYPIINIRQDPAKFNNMLGSAVNKSYAYIWWSFDFKPFLFKDHYCKL